tara:strand:- start:772 stop:1050 length:279 start_codon:yes stop_codon:yes gene_type:complete
MGNDFEDWCSDVVIPIIQEKYNIKMESIYDFDAGINTYKMWADDWERAQLEHTYEEPWRAGWIDITDINNQKYKFNWYLKDNDEVTITKKVK